MCVYSTFAMKCSIVDKSRRTVYIEAGCAEYSSNYYSVNSSWVISLLIIVLINII